MNRQALTTLALIHGLALALAIAGCKAPPRAASDGGNACDLGPADGCPCLDGEPPVTCGTAVGACQAASRTCADGHWTACEGGVGPTAEACNGKDDDCDGVIPADEVDRDNDGYRLCDGDCDDDNANVHQGCACKDGETEACGSNVGTCVQGTKTCTNDVWGDCVGAIGPTAETCDGKDDDCDGVIPANEADADKDGLRICAGDCDDHNASVHPGATDVCNGVDENCNGVIDDGVSCTYTWKTTSFNACPAGACSMGLQTRQVWCERSDGAHVAESLCAGTRPAESQSCLNTVGCSWYAGDWGACSAKCDGGTSIRPVYCRDGAGAQVPSSWCAGVGGPPYSSKSCNTFACVVDVSAGPSASMGPCWSPPNCLGGYPDFPACPAGYAPTRSETACGNPNGCGGNWALCTFLKLNGYGCANPTYVMGVAVRECTYQ